MIRFSVALSLVCTVLGLVMPATARALPALECGELADDPRSLARIRADLIEAVNAERADAGLVALQGDSLLDFVAQGHALDMARRRVMSHDGGDGSRVGERAERAGYAYWQIGENVATGQSSVAQVVRGWMGSPPHRETILMANGRELGVGFAIGGRTTSRPGTVIPGCYWVMVVAQSAEKGGPGPEGQECGGLSTTPAGLARLRETVLTAFNRARRRGDLAPLAGDARLMTAAQSHAEAMARYGSMTLPDALGSLADWATRSGYEYLRLAQHTAVGHMSGEALVERWIGSASVLDTVAMPEARHVGLGFAEGRRPTTEGRDIIPGCYFSLFIAEPVGGGQ